MSERDKYYYKLGIKDARKKYYPLYSVLVAADEYSDARSYARGWSEVTGRDLSSWRDGNRR